MRAHTGTPGTLEASVRPRAGDGGPRPQELVCCLDETGRGCSKMISWPGWFDNQGPSWGHTLERLLPSCRIPNPKPLCNQGRCRLARAHDAYVTSRGIAPWGDAHVDGDGFVSLAAKRGELGGWRWAAGSVSARLRSWSSAIGSAAQDLHDPCRLQLRGLSCMCLDGWSGGVKEGAWHRRRAATTVMQRSSSALRCTRLHRAMGRGEGGGLGGRHSRRRAGGQERHGHAGADRRA